jgi:alkylhydroperoxidase/carboxymuconolactone decarboxylase family protein YurZ
VSTSTPGPLALDRFAGSLQDMRNLPERTPYFRANEHFNAYFKEVHAGAALDAKTKELIHLALVLALHCEP